MENSAAWLGRWRGWRWSGRGSGDEGGGGSGGGGSGGGGTGGRVGASSGGFGGRGEEGRGPELQHTTVHHRRSHVVGELLETRLELGQSEGSPGPLTVRLYTLLVTSIPYIRTYTPLTFLPRFNNTALKP